METQNETISKKKRRKKRVIKFFVILFITIVLVIACYFAYKMKQLKNLEKMTIRDIVNYVTEKEDIYVSVAIIENGETTYHIYGQNGKELADTDYDYEIGSISKTMAALLVSRAISEGKISLSDSISKYLDLPDGYYYPTIERLLTHTSGYKSHYMAPAMMTNWMHKRNDFFNVPKSCLLEKVKEIHLSDKDYNFVYSNFGLSVIGLVLESVYQKDYIDLLTDYLHTELNMNDTSVATCTGNLSGYWDWAKDDGYIPAGAVISTISDMAIYLNTYMTSDETYVTRPLQSLKKVDTHDPIHEGMGIRIDEMAMSWCVDTEHHYIWHNGGTSNYNTYIALSEDRQKGIVILTNYGPYTKIPATVIGARFMNGETDWEKTTK